MSEISEEIPFSVTEINKYIIDEDVMVKKNKKMTIKHIIKDDDTRRALRTKLFTKKDDNTGYKQECSNYDAIYAMGDLHADYASFYKRLENFKLINAPTKSNEEGNVKIDIKNPVDSKNYLPTLTSEFEWIPERTLLVITGDIIDGCRDGKDIDDPYGSSELLLHMFLKNLKFKAMKKQSNVICIFGNHDMFLFFPEKKSLLTEYVHTRAINFFFVPGDDVIEDKNEKADDWLARGLQNRTNWLAPFYKNNFYFLHGINTFTFRHIKTII
jgi:hypothetical protein